MIDKEKLTSHIKDINLKATMYKVIDKAQMVLKNHIPKYTDFLDPYELRNAISILNSIYDIKYEIYGGYKQAERNLIFIYPDYMDSEMFESPITVLEITLNSKYADISHRDCLGAILGLGIKREKIGDIFICENCCQIILQSDLSDFVLLNLKKVASSNINIRRISENNIKVPKIEYKEICTSVSSLRLDCVISAVFNLSRQEANKYILGDRVKVDFELVSIPSKSVKEGILLSVKGKGRAILHEVGSLTKKGRIKILAKIIV
ncbi:RNA-binding protein YlmH, contains S4-like domain [Alkalithermobacter thermoalcaliphilus JW-YL-7 = DSM 7308]|uniref:RNA-binding S4 domain protein n=1 Tax=Alkalithermobacter thermoalcaliphilus JW-YL-7 = DSM 7308 TaxID=1121328 RepID=A0A150FPS9_CLOPD|nr:RNA-binding S4 domain protein [[Clostridium] paradoxum JW-YL-7 = DSM 7308]SHK97356.1 RNA-binding protein YlmH, contains S4-like domain [[Clostridium] paradoxum JW-YL-7 = DSM 7308]